MNPFFEKLRSAREQHGLSLDDIADATKIGRAILKDLEAGETSKLPATYVRAFLRSYAKEVGLDASEVLREYAEISAPPAAAPGPADGAERRGNLTLRISAKRLTEHHVPLIAAGLLIVSLVISIAVIDKPGKEEAKEIPFSEVVRQREPAAENEVDSQAAPEKPGMFVASEPSPDTAPPPVTLLPPLVLRAMTFDSVWIRIVIDGKIRKDYTVPARWSGQWKASDNFIVSVSKIEAVSLTLNNRSLGLPGTPGSSVRNFVIRRPGPQPR